MYEIGLRKEIVLKENEKTLSVVARSRVHLNHF